MIIFLRELILTLNNFFFLQLIKGNRQKKKKKINSLTTHKLFFINYFVFLLFFVRYKYIINKIEQLKINI
jgi:hypothetical protein